VTLLAIDPGILTGWAVFDSRGGLQACGLGEDFPTLSERVAVIERPQVYRASKSKGDPNDLITLAIRVGRYYERLEKAGVRVHLVLPTTWKGQVPKTIHHERIAGSMPATEVEIVRRVEKKIGKLKCENVWDAIGLGRWAAQTSSIAVSRDVKHTRVHGLHQKEEHRAR
jgi:hypothetical protein